MTNNVLENSKWFKNSYKWLEISYKYFDCIFSQIQKEEVRVDLLLICLSDSENKKFNFDVYWLQAENNVQFNSIHIGSFLNRSYAEDFIIGTMQKRFMNQFNLSLKSDDEEGLI